MSQQETFKLSKKAQIIFIAMIVIGVFGAILTLLNGGNQHSVFWSNLLLNSYFFTGIALTGMFFVTSHCLGYGGWQTVVRRVPEAFGMFLPITAVLTLIIIIGTALGWHNLYAHWSDPHHAAALPPEKLKFLNIKFFAVAIIVYFILWMGLSFLWRRTSLDQDKKPLGANYKKQRVIAAVFLLVFGISSSTVSWHMNMSLDPHWYSTLFGWYNFASYTCAGFAFMILILGYLKSKGLLKEVKSDHLHDLGKYLFGFSIFYTYLWFSQFLLQWYANVPEDTIWFVKRFDVPLFKFLFFAGLILNFIAPLLLLMTRGAKRNWYKMAALAGIVIFGHFLDFFFQMMYEPNVATTHHEMVEEHAKADNKNEVMLYAQNGHTASDATESNEVKAEEHVTNAEEMVATEAHGAEISNEHAVGAEAAKEEHLATEATHGQEHEMAEGHEEGHIKNYASVNFGSLFMLIGFIGAFLWVVLYGVSKAPLIPENDVYLAESEHHHI